MQGVTFLSGSRVPEAQIDRPALVVAVTFRLLDALRAFDLVYVLTGNRPETSTVSMFVRQQLIDFQDTGYGSAAATLTLFLVALATALYLTAGRRVGGATA